MLCEIPKQLGSFFMSLDKEIAWSMLTLCYIIALVCQADMTAEERDNKSSMHSRNQSPKQTRGSLHTTCSSLSLRDYTPNRSSVWMKQLEWIKLQRQERHMSLSPGITEHRRYILSSEDELSDLSVVRCPFVHGSSPVMIWTEIKYLFDYNED